MLIRFCGAGHVRRMVGPHTWEPGKARRAVDVDAGLAAILLTEPGADFEIDAAEPLLGVASRDEVGALALAGVDNVGGLAGLRGKGLTAAAAESGIAVKRLRAMVRQAKGVAEEGPARPPEDKPGPATRG